VIYRQGKDVAEVRPRPRSFAIIGSLGALYMAQGIPFGFATEYLPVVLRESGMSYAGIAALGWLQLPWQLKIFWAKAADHPKLRSQTRRVILAMQLALTVTVAAFAISPLKSTPMLWFGLTFVAAALAATQDVFVDAFAVRVLRPDERGFGNTAQVAGYRFGMLIGGAALLLLVGKLGERMTLLSCAVVVAAASLGAFVGSEDVEPASATTPSEDEEDEEETKKKKNQDRRNKALGIKALAKHAFSKEAFPVLGLALTFKLGLHMAVGLLKPMAVDYGWTKQQIGAAVVSVGSASALAGAAVGGVLHRALHEKRALFAALFFQALVCAPLIIVDRLHAPLGLTTAAIAAEHFGSGLGTTVLFAALMTATRPADAGLHYTVLTSANALALGLGAVLGGLMADLTSKTTTFAVATIVCLLPGFLISRWNEAAHASRA
jgi:MFS transporter, PAT family, beta-lactamase induction signal transducer AmpG